MSIAPDRLANIPLFVGMSAQQHAQLARVLSIARHAAGDVIISQGADGQGLWVLLDGKCSVLSRAVKDCDSVLLAELEPPAHFGEMSFFHHTPHSASVRADTAVELLRLKYEDFERLIESGDIGAYRLALNVLEVMSDRLRRMDEWVTELVCKGHDGRQVSEWSKFRQALFGAG
jgi:CRP-like cAMP-binding protein